MATPTLKAVGFCAHYSKQGDWAFSYALELSRLHSLKLNVFHFLEDPYERNNTNTRYLTKAQRFKLAVERERELRLCADNEWTELHRCLMIREFQVLVSTYPRQRATFARKSIEEFAGSFICPVVLKGPDRPNQFKLNEPAALFVDKLAIPLWNKIAVA